MIGSRISALEGQMCWVVFSTAHWGRKQKSAVFIGHVQVEPPRFKMVVPY